MCSEREDREGMRFWDEEELGGVLGGDSSDEVAPLGGERLRGIEHTGIMDDG